MLKCRQGKQAKRHSPITLSCPSYSPDSVLPLDVRLNFSSTYVAPEVTLEDGTVMARDLRTTPLADWTSRRAMRLLRETRSVLEYSFPMMAVGQVNQFLSGNIETINNAITPTIEVKTLVSIVSRTILDNAWLLKYLSPTLRRFVQ